MQFLGKIFPAVRRITTWKKESDLTDDNHIGKMWKQVIADNVQEEKKNDLVELKQKTEVIEERVGQMEKDILNTMKLLREMDFVFFITLLSELTNSAKVANKKASWTTSLGSTGFSCLTVRVSRVRRRSSE